MNRKMKSKRKRRAAAADGIVNDILREGGMDETVA